MKNPELKYRITNEVVSAFEKVKAMQGKLNIEKIIYSESYTHQIIAKAVLDDMIARPYLSIIGSIVKRSDLFECRGLCDKLGTCLIEDYRQNAIDLYSLLNKMLFQTKPEPEPEPSFAEIANKEFEAAKILLGGGEGVVFAVSPKNVRRFCLDAACDIAQQSNHLHAVLKALADSMGLMDKKGEQE